MEELEAKLDVPPGFDVPDLTGVLPGTAPDPVEAVELDATYWDTAGLALLQAGATLRHREGRWQVKVALPRPDADMLRRHELDVDGPPEAPPREALRVVRTLTGPARLEPVARLVTRRRRVRLRRAAGVAIEVADDTVEVRSADPEAPRVFRELEVEVGSAGAVEDLRRGVDALLQAGARRAPPLTKLGRALRDRAPAASGALPTGSPPSGAGLRAAVGRAIADLTAGDIGAVSAGDPEPLARPVRHTRGLLEAGRALLPEDVVDGVLPGLVDLDAAVGAATDAQRAVVLEDRLRSGLRDAALVEALEARAVAAHARARALSDSETVPAVVDRLRETLAGPLPATGADVAPALRAARVRSRSLRRHPATDPARARAINALRAALEVACGPASAAAQDATGVLNALDLARRAATVRDVGGDVARAVDDPAAAFACRAVAARADGLVRAASRRARRRWVTLDALTVGRAARGLARPATAAA